MDALDRLLADRRLLEEGTQLLLELAGEGGRPRLLRLPDEVAQLLEVTQDVAGRVHFVRGGSEVVVPEVVGQAALRRGVSVRLVVLLVAFQKLKQNGDQITSNFLLRNE